MNTLSFFTPIEIDASAKDTIQLKYGVLRHCAHFIAPNFSGRKVYIIGQTHGNLITDLNRKEETVSKISYLLTVALKIVCMSTLIFPILALIGTVIFHRNNTFIDKNAFNLQANTDTNKTIVDCDIDSEKKANNNIGNVSRELTTKSIVSEQPLISPHDIPNFPIALSRSREVANQVKEDSIKDEINGLFPTNSEKILEHLNQLPKRTNTHGNPKQKLSKFISNSSRFIPSIRVLPLAGNPRLFLNQIITEKLLFQQHFIYSIPRSIPLQGVASNDESDDEDIEDLVLINSSVDSTLIKESTVFEMQRYVATHHPELTNAIIESFVMEGKKHLQFIWNSSEKDYNDWVNTMKTQSDEQQLQWVKQMIWCLMAEAAAQSKTFVEGSFIFLDPERRLYDVLRRLNGTYDRISSHLKGCSPAYHKGIDIPDHGLPAHKGHVLFTHLLDKPDRIFIKCESHGTKGLMSLLLHGFEFILSLGRKTAPCVFGSDEASGCFKERIPQELVIKFRNLIKDIPNGTKLIDDVIKAGTGIGGMYTCIQHICSQIVLPLEKRQEVEGFIQDLKDRFGTDKLSRRIGNEVIPRLTGTLQESVWVNVLA